MKKTKAKIIRGGAPQAPAYEPIQTYYHGQHFRSRIEARWAVFYDGISVPWEYEKEGFNIEGTMYLPDFWMPGQDCWIEIKGPVPTDEECRKAQLLAEATDKRVLIFFGGIARDIGPGGPLDTDSALLFYPGLCVDDCYAWCECPTCGKFGIEYEARADRMPCCWRRRDRGHSGDTWRLLHAYQAARHSRFDSSDRPKVSMQ